MHNLREVSVLSLRSLWWLRWLRKKVQRLELPRWFLKIVWENFVVKQFASFLRTNCERAKDQHLHLQIVCMSYFYNSRLLRDNSNSLTYEPRKGAKSNTCTCQLCDCTCHADWLFTIIILTWTYEDLFRFVTNALKKAPVFWEAIAIKTWRNKLSELKTVSLSRIARENLVNYYDATIYHSDKNPGIS